MSLVSVFAAILSGGWGVIKTWLWTFAVSFTHLQTIWIIIPIWLSWFFAEFFQEKEGTSFGNAISNGVVPFWVGFDWIRQLTTTHDGFGWAAFGKYSISALLILYGLAIIVFGIRGKEIVRYIGRIRVVTYILLVFTPFIYGVIEATWMYWLSIIIFLPIFYVLIELVDQDTPEPRAIHKDKGGDQPALQQI